MRLAPLVVAVGLLVGCSSSASDCPRRLKTRAVYTGAQTGWMFSRMWTGNACVSGSGGPWVAGAPGATTDSCWNEVAAAPTPGFRLEAWIDTDADAQDVCQQHICDATMCAPDPGEPQGSKDFTVAAAGTTDIVLQFGDP